MNPRLPLDLLQNLGRREIARPGEPGHLMLHLGRATVFVDENGIGNAHACRGIPRQQVHSFREEARKEGIV